METIWHEFTFGLTEPQQLARVVIRLVAAVLLGALIGYERERAGKPAGFRTHILIVVGTCLFVLAGSSYGMSSDGLSRIIQGIVTGIGFLGAGSILKLSQEHHIRGLTTAAGILMAAAIGVTIGLGMLGIATIATILAILVLAVLRRYEKTNPPVNE